MRTVSVKCPRCNYVRYDLLHISRECGGLLVRDNYNNVYCKLCSENMNFANVTCPNCGYYRSVALGGTYIKIIRMEIFETYIIQ